MHQIGDPANCRAPDCRCAANQPRGGRKGERFVSNGCSGKPSQRSPMRTADDPLFDAALGQGRDCVQTEGFSATGGGAGDHMQNAHFCPWQKNPALRPNGAEKKTLPLLPVKHGSFPAVRNCLLDGRASA